MMRILLASSLVLLFAGARGYGESEPQKIDRTWQNIKIQAIQADSDREMARIKAKTEVENARLRAEKERYTAARRAEAEKYAAEKEALTAKQNEEAKTRRLSEEIAARQAARASRSPASAQ